jgi:hypothetical protein
VSEVFGKRSKNSGADPAQVTEWFRNWSNLGWFCAPPQKQNSSQNSKKR